MSFTDSDTVKEILGISLDVTSCNGAIEAALKAAEKWVLRALCLESTDVQTYVVRADVDDCNTDAVAVCPRPVVALQEVKNGGVVLDASRYDLIPPFIVRLRDGRAWNVGSNVVEITLTAGFDPVPDDLAFGVAQLAAMLQDFKPWMKRETIGRYSYEVSEDRETWPPVLQGALEELLPKLGGYMPIALVR